jgi:hypothetical protein
MKRRSERASVRRDPRLTRSEQLGLLVLLLVFVGYVLVVLGRMG